MQSQIIYKNFHHEARLKRGYEFTSFYTRELDIWKEKENTTAIAVYAFFRELL